MKVINLNSKLHLTSAQIDFAESVMEMVKPRYRFTLDDVDFEFFMERIPVYLLDEATMESWERTNEKEYSKEYDSERRPPIEWFGFYCSNCSVFGATHPAIALCPERIERCSSDDTELCWVITMTLIHDFGHAYMDISKYGHHDEFHDSIEEPMANLFTLEVIKRVKKYDKYAFLNYHHYHQYVHSKCLTKNNTLFDMSAFYEFVKGFIRHQPDNYRIAAYMYDDSLFLSRIQTWARNKTKFNKLTWQKRLWLDYWKSVLGGKSQYDGVVVKNIWSSFENLNYKRFKELLNYFMKVFTEASQGSLVSHDKLKENMSSVGYHLEGDFKLVLDRSDWKNSYIYWEYNLKVCDVKIYPRFDGDGNLYSFEAIDNVSKKKFILKCEDVGSDDDSDSCKFLETFLDTFTESAIRSIF